MEKRKRYNQREKSAVLPLSYSELNITPNYFNAVEKPYNTQVQSKFSAGELGLFGNNIITNQRNYKRLWTEKQHEKEIQELLLRKESAKGKPYTSFVQYEEMEEDFGNIFGLGENNYSFYLLKETADYLTQVKEPLKQLKRLEGGMLFPIGIQSSEVQDIMLNELEDQKVKYETFKSKFNEMEMLNIELRGKIQELEKKVAEKNERIKWLEAELGNTRDKLKSHLLNIHAMTFKENMKAAAADYAVIKQQLQVSLKDNEQLTLKLTKEKELNKELKSLNASLLMRLGNKSVSILMDQATNTDKELLAHKVYSSRLSQLLSIQKVSTIIVSMLAPKDFFNIILSAKAIYNLLRNQDVYIHLLNKLALDNNTKVKRLEETIEGLKENDKKFEFLKGANVSSDPEFTRLVDEYICKKKVIGNALIKPLVDSRSFLYSGDIDNKSLPNKKPEDSGGFFSGWGISSVLNFAKNTIAIPKDTQNKKEIETLNLIINSEKQLTPSSICEMLNKMALELRQKQASRLSVWVKQLQLCFGMLFKGCIEFYLEAKDIEKLKDFLLYRVEDLKKKLTAITIQRDEHCKSIENARELMNYMSEKVKVLDRQNLLLSTENVKCKKTINLLEKKYEEERVAMVNRIVEQQKAIKLLVQRAKRIENTQSTLDVENREYRKELAGLSDYFNQIREQLMNC